MEMKDLFPENEKPLDRLCEDGGFCRIFRTIGCIGDSLSSGEFEVLNADGTRSWLDRFEYSWGQDIARRCGSKVYNFSRGGMTARWYLRDYASQKGFWDDQKACNAYIIALGVNDTSEVLAGKLTFGEVSDIHPEDYHQNAETFLGYYGAILQRYRQISPGAPVFLVSPPRGRADNEKRSELYDRLRDALYRIAEMFERVYVIDLRAYAPVYDEAFNKKFFLNGHMNSAGYVLTGKMISSYIDYIVRQDPSAFDMAWKILPPQY